jgi:formylglycine-generating enzyme required for sulfatase activity
MSTREEPALDADLGDLRRWDDLAPERREAVARAVAARLPGSFRFAGMATHTLGDQTHTLAFFDRDGARFALIPGGEVTLGYDQAAFMPSPGQVAAMDEMREYFADDEEDATVDLPAYLAQLVSREYKDRFLMPVRRATIAPFLLETQATEAGVFPVAAEEYLTAAQIASFRRQPGMQAEMGVSGQAIRVRSGDADGVRVFVHRHPSHAEVTAALARSGFRLPSSDEWEYACGAGGRTLFRWGDDCPLRRLPILDDEDEPDSAWDLHERSNAFGLHFSGNPYDWEICAEPGLMRGGDGGVAICGGEGTVAAWTALATAFAWRWEHDKLFGAHVRRAYSLL